MCEFLRTLGEFLRTKRSQPLTRFRSDARVNGAWKTVFSDDLNILRLRKVSFAPVEADALRLVVTETWGQSYDKPKPRAHIFAFDAL